MRIIECYIENFGKLSKQKFTFTNGFNCFLADNGTGKTTLSVFIKAMLYGLGDSRKQGVSENERRRYLPWSGAVASGTLSFVLGGRSYKIERSFGKKPTEDTFALYDLGTGLLSKDFSERIGEEIFEINENGFERTVFFSERAIPHDADDGTVAAKLSDLSGVDADLADFGGAMERLDKRRRLLMKRGGGGLLSDLKNEISRSEKDLELLGEQRERRASIEKALSEAKMEHEKLSSRRAELLGYLKDSKSTDKRKASRRGTALSVIFLLLAVASLPFGFLLSPILYAASALIFLLSVISFALSKKKGSSRPALTKLSPEEEISELTEEGVRLLTKISALEKEREDVLGYLELHETLGDEHAKLLSDYKSAESELRSVRLAMEFLERARASVTAKYIGRTRTLLSEYIREIDRDATPLPEMATDFSLTVEENGKTRESEAYSKGTERLYSFAARLAFSESLYSGELPFIILDDPFVYLDDPRCKAALALLVKISKKRQVIYFTASRSRGT